MQARNIMEDIVKKYLDEMLALRFDICTCEMCRQDVIAYVLTRLPPKYVTTDSGAIHAIMQQVRVAARRKYTPEEKFRIVLEGFRW